MHYFKAFKPTVSLILITLMKTAEVSFIKSLAHMNKSEIIPLVTREHFADCLLQKSLEAYIIVFCYLSLLNVIFLQSCFNAFYLSFLFKYAMAFGMFISLIDGLNFEKEELDVNKMKNQIASK